MSDRTVHGRWNNGTELVRYERAGKWYQEHPDHTRCLISGREVVAAALGADEVYLDQPGGAVMSRRYREAKLREDSDE